MGNYLLHSSFTFNVKFTLAASKSISLNSVFSISVSVNCGAVKNAYRDDDVNVLG